MPPASRSRIASNRIILTRPPSRKSDFGPALNGAGLSFPKPSPRLYKHGTNKQDSHSENRSGSAELLSRFFLPFGCAMT
jgi:hypothetical protein